MPIPQPHSHLAIWLAANRIRLLDALAAALDSDVGDVLHRLGIRFRDLVIAPPPALTRTRRPRGRPTRAIDRECVLASLRRHCGRHRPVARETQIPRSTLTRFVATIPDHAWKYGEQIAERHGELLARSGVGVEVARARGYISGNDGLVVPLWNERGVKVWSQVRFDSPKDRRSRYGNSPDAAATIDLNPFARQMVLDPDRPLYVTEGPRKADAAISRGLACVACPGVRMLCLDPERWRYIGVERREVRIVFDADAVHKPDVGLAEERLVEFLRSLGARVRIVRLPGFDTGLDDYLATRHTEIDLLRLATS